MKNNRVKNRTRADIEHHQQFVAACKQLARYRKISLNQLFENAHRIGVTSSWLKMRYYDRCLVSSTDLEQVRNLTDGADAIQGKLSYMIKMQAAVDKFCKVCVGHDVACRYRTCELRPFSPYEFVKLETKRYE
jgi:hypothetical protein